MYYMYTCIETFKTTLFDDGEPKRIEIQKDSDWFYVRKETQDRVVLSNNKMELVIAKKLLDEKFKGWG